MEYVNENNSTIMSKLKGYWYRMDISNIPTLELLNNCKI